MSGDSLNLRSVCSLAHLRFISFGDEPELSSHFSLVFTGTAGGHRDPM